MKKRTINKLRKIEHTIDYLSFTLTHYFGILFTSIFSGLLLYYWIGNDEKTKLVIFSGIIFLFISIEFLINPSNPKKMKKHMTIYLIITLILFLLTLSRMLFFN